MSAQQTEEKEKGESWDYYNSWSQKSTNTEKREADDSFICILRNTYYRPRDIVMALKIMKENVQKNNRINDFQFIADDFLSNEPLNEYSDYLLGTIKDQLSFYYTTFDYDEFLMFFTFLNRKSDFSYQEYLETFEKYEAYLIEKSNAIPKFVDSAEEFLQFLYENNIICFYEEGEQKTLFSWCYRERRISNINPRVKINVNYRVHYGLQKALHLSK